MGGWMVAIEGGRVRMLGHTGSNTMWYAIAAVLPISGYIVVVVANRADEGLEMVPWQVLARYVTR